jgi:hypothetical protein
VREEHKEKRELCTQRVAKTLTAVEMCRVGPSPIYLICRTIYILRRKIKKARETTKNLPVPFGGGNSLKTAKQFFEIEVIPHLT